MDHQDNRVLIEQCHEVLDRLPFPQKGDRPFGEGSAQVCPTLDHGLAGARARQIQKLHPDALLGVERQVFRREYREEDEDLGQSDPNGFGLRQRNPGPCNKGCERENTVSNSTSWRFLLSIQAFIALPCAFSHHGALTVQ